jgi:ABC-2 type transport system ATP-binding protein
MRWRPCRRSWRTGGWSWRRAARRLVYTFDSNDPRTGVPSLMRRMSDLGIAFKDLNTKQSSLEDIFVDLVHQR